MPFEIVRNDITNMRVDAIVNTANPRPIIGAGVDSAIHKAAGPDLFDDRKKIGAIAMGDAVITPAYNLNAKYVIHTAGPMWVDGKHGEGAALRSCYHRSLLLAAEYQCKSIAFPLISAGTYGFPKDLALEIATNCISSFLMNYEMMVYLVVFDRAAFSLSEKLFQAVTSYIDEHYVESVKRKEYRNQDDDRRQRRLRDFPESYDRSETLSGESFHDTGSNAEISQKWSVKEEGYLAPPAPAACSSEAIRKQTPEAIRKQVPESMQKQTSKQSSKMPAPSRKLEDLLREVEYTFSEAVFKWIDSKGKTDPEIYKKANLDRKLFSKIRNNTYYKPSKTTALALAIALELNLDETKDLIGRAGYALTHSSKSDIIIEYFITQGNYDIFEINEVLFAFDQPLIGG